MTGMGTLSIGRDRLPIGDVALAVTLAAVAALDVLLSPDWLGPVAVNVIVVPAVALSLAWRRVRPMLTLAVVMAGLSSLSLAFGGSQAWSNVFITMVAVYSAAGHSPQPVVAAVLAAVGIAVHDLRDPAIQSFGDAAWSSTLLGLTFLAGLAGRSVRIRAAAVEQRARELEQEETALAAAAAVEERRRIARELHDILSHSLGVLVLQAGAAEQVMQRDPERARQVLASIRTAGQRTIEELRVLLGLVDEEPGASTHPRPSLADVSTLRTEVEKAGLPVELHIRGQRRDLPAAVELSAFRVIQEGLTNALKHSGAAQARVTLRYGDVGLDVEIEDDGTGRGGASSSGRGLLGLRERVTVFGGQFDAGPKDGGGWRLCARFPANR